MVEVKFDPTIQLPEIRMPIYSETEDNDPSVIGHDTSVIQQTKLDGIIVPLLRINNQTIFYTEIVSMELYCNKVPKLDVVIEDQTGMIKDFDSPSFDNIIQLQILPPFEGGYKKINLMFYITSIYTEGHTITINATYHIPNLWNHRLKAYGQISSYEFMEQTAKEFGLGFCSNIDSTPDKRYIYNPMMTTIDHINQVTQYAHSDDKYSIFDWWIDYWNNLNFVNIYNEYNEILPEDKMQIWATDISNHAGGDDDTQNLVKMIAAVSNHPFFLKNQLYISDYTPEFNSPGVTDQIFDTYSMNTLEQQTTVIENGDVKDNLQQVYVYGGEIFGDYDYLARETAKSMFLSKINAQTITTSITKPSLGLIQGFHLNVWWYDIGNYLTEDMQLQANEVIESNIELPDSILAGESNYIINKMVSGQYYISNMSLQYKPGFQWKQEFVLSRDGKNIEKYNPVQMDESEKN